MVLERIGDRGILVSLGDPYLTNIYVINGYEYLFILDTGFGSASLRALQSELNKLDYKGKKVIVFNSHADYDHYWGNSVFHQALIISHHLCQERILLQGYESLKIHFQDKRGEVIITPPNLTFTSQLSFPNEGLEFFYSPGHTLDSASCFDTIDRVLFVGDNVESPLPYLNHPNFGQYIQTLESYLEIDWKLLIPGHDPPLETPDLIRRNIDYLHHFIDWSFDLQGFSKAELHRHVQYNLNAIKAELLKVENRSELLRHLEEVKKLNV
jgi:cyclase